MKSTFVWGLVALLACTQVRADGNNHGNYEPALTSSEPSAGPAVEVQKKELTEEERLSNLLAAGSRIARITKAKYIDDKLYCELVKNASQQTNYFLGMMIGRPPTDMATHYFMSASMTILHIEQACNAGTLNREEALSFASRFEREISNAATVYRYPQK